MAFNTGRRRSIMRIDENINLPHWYNREDKDQLRSIFVKLESLCHLEVPSGSRMIREFVGSVFRRGVISFEPFVDFSIITICKDRTQGKEQDDFEHVLNMALITWDTVEGLPISVEYITAEPTVRYSFGKVIAPTPPFHPESTLSSSNGYREMQQPTTVLKSAKSFRFGAGRGGQQHSGGGDKGGSGATTTTTTTTVTPGGMSTPPPEAFTIKMLTKYYPEILCLPKYPRAKDRDLDYATKEVVSSASNKARFVLRVKDSTAPSGVTYTYAAGMPSRSLSRGSDTSSNLSSSNNHSGSYSPGGSPGGYYYGDSDNEIVFFPKYIPPACCGQTSTSERSPWGPRPSVSDEEEEEYDGSDSDEGGGPPEVMWEEDDEWN